MEAVGLTGGIGSGKSTVARILLHLGYPVYIADTEASRLMNILPEIRFELIHHFGKSVYAPRDNSTNRFYRKSFSIIPKP